MKAYKDTYYFTTHATAKEYALGHGLRADRIIRYDRGYAVQFYESGPYAGPSTPTWDGIYYWDKPEIQAIMNPH